MLVFNHPAETWRFLVLAVPDQVDQAGVSQEGCAASHHDLSGAVPAPERSRDPGDILWWEPAGSGTSGFWGLTTVSSEALFMSEFSWSCGCLHHYE